jgi:hypothetical protein
LLETPSLPLFSDIFINHIPADDEKLPNQFQRQLHSKKPLGITQEGLTENIRQPVQSNN